MGFQIKPVPDRTPPHRVYVPADWHAEWLAREDRQKKAVPASAAMSQIDVTPSYLDYYLLGVVALLVVVRILLGYFFR